MADGSDSVGYGDDDLTWEVSSRRNPGGRVFSRSGVLAFSVQAKTFAQLLPAGADLS